MCKWGDFFAISDSHIAWSFPSIFCSREYMVWKKMLVEEFQDGSLVHDHLWCVIGWFMLFLSLHIGRSLPQVFCARRYMVRKEMVDEEFKGSWIVHGHLWCVNGVIFAISESPYSWNPSIKFLIKRIYGLEDVGWRIRRWLFTAWPSLMCEWMIFAISEYPLCQKPSSSFLRKRIYSLEGDGG